MKKAIFILLLMSSVFFATKITATTMYPPESFHTPGGYVVTIYPPYIVQTEETQYQIFVDITVANPQRKIQPMTYMKEEESYFFFGNDIKVTIHSYCLSCADGNPKVEADIFDYTAEQEEGYTYSTKLRINEGWNLVTSNLDHIAWGASTCTPQSFGPIYFFDSFDKKYVSLNEADFNENFMQESAAWMYAVEECEIVYFDLDTRDMIPLIAGWNFLGMTSGLKNKIFGQTTTGCKFEKMHYFTAESNSWSTNLNPTKNALQVQLGKGFVVKVEKDCILKVS